MRISGTLLPEYDQEMANTRKTLERVPEDKFGWKPHEKSMTLGRLAQHLSEIPSWANFTIDKDSLDIAPPGAPPYQPPRANSRRELLQLFDKNVTAARAAIAGASDEHLKKPWTLLFGGKTVFTLPRIAVLRTSVMNHGIHHRAQLGVYLRLNNVPVPALYGPSADEGSM
ncbi:MAG TPA: DinB family protein [Acidobacteriota bacterium]|jgi:uncharacterized damage-inducible protein DinB|nr:DinB family protein [Acidobacteriota bacterium]